MMDLCSCGSVKDIMKATMETLNEIQIAYVCSETLKGLIVVVFYYKDFITFISLTFNVKDSFIFTQ